MVEEGKPAQGFYWKTALLYEDIIVPLFINVGHANKTSTTVLFKKPPKERV